MSASRLGAVLAAAAIALAGLWWVTAGNFHLIKVWNFGNVYEAQTISLLSGRADIPCNLATGEAFVRDGKCYIYFGPVPGLLRLPVLWLKPQWTGQLGNAMVWVAHLLFLAAISLILVEAGYPLGTWTSTFYLVLTAFGSTIPNLWGWPTTWVEAISWAVALAACSLYCLLKWDRTRKGAWLIAACLLAILAFFTRVSTGAGPMLAVSAAALLAWRGRPSRRGAAAAVVFLLGLSAVAYLALNKARMGSYVNPVPIQLHVQYDEERMARLGGTLFHPEKGLPILITYLVEAPQFRRGFPWLEYRPSDPFDLTGMDFVDLHAGVLLTMPALVWLAWAGWRRSPGKPVWWLLLPPLVGIALLVTVAAIAERYVHEFLLLLAPAGAFGLHWSLATPVRRWLTFLLSAWSIYACWALALVEQREVMYWVSQDSLDRYCDTRSGIDRLFDGSRPGGGARVRLAETGSTYEFDGARWQRCAGPAAHRFRIELRFATLPEAPAQVLSIGKAPEAESITLERVDAPGHYRLRMDHPGKSSELGDTFELAPGRAYLLECELDRMNRRLAVKLDGVQIGQRRTGLVRWLEKEVTVAKFGRWLSD